MTLIVLGASHRSASLATLERLVLTDEAAGKLVRDLMSSESITEAVVISTCNRVELYIEAERFHPAVQDATELWSRHSGAPESLLPDASYVFNGDRAVQHLFSVACGLDSLAVGESQILGQVRVAVRRAESAGTLGTVLSAVTNAALRVGKQAHTDTDLDSAAPSLVESGLALAAQKLGGLAGRAVLLVGAGSMGALARAALAAVGAEVTVLSRSAESARRLAGDGRSDDLTALPAELAAADLIVCCTGAPQPVVTAALAAAARRRSATPQVYLDLALPRDVAADVAHLPGVTLIDLGGLGRAAPDAAGGAVATVRAMVSDEVAAFAAWQRQRSVVPTVAALRSRAGAVVDAELTRLMGRVPHLSQSDRAEVARTVHRVVDKLLHTPTVRLRESALAEPSSASYTEVVRSLFDLDGRAIEALSTVDLTGVTASVSASDGRP